MKKFIDKVSEFISKMMCEAEVHRTSRHILQMDGIPLDRIIAIKVVTQALDVKIVQGDYLNCDVCLETNDDRDTGDSISFSVKVESGILLINSVERSFNGAELIVRLPTLKLRLEVISDSGDVSVMDLVIGEIDVRTISSDISIAGVRCESMKLISRNGDITVFNSCSRNPVQAKSANGDIVF